MLEIEKRSGYTNTKFETFVNNESKSLFLRGYAIVVNEPTIIYDKRKGFYTEVITKEALDNVDLSDVFLLFGHDYNQPLGHTSANLRFEVDDIGLFYECELPNTRLARDTYNLVESKKYLGREQAGSVIQGNSFSFFSDDEVINGIRTVKRFVVDEISIVARPAYELACSVTATRQNNAQNVEHQQSAENNADTNVEHQQDEEALRMAQALDEKLKKLEEL